MLARRKFLRLAGMAPFAARAASEKAILSLGHISAGPSTALGLGIGQEVCSPKLPSVREMTIADWRVALNIPSVRKEVESTFYENERDVSRIDPDIAVYRSFSMAAKIAYQRQRNVERRVAQLTTEHFWSRFESIGKRFLGIT